MIKNPPTTLRDTRDVSLIPGWGKYPAVGNGTTLQCFCLENSMGREAVRATAQGVAKSWTWLSGSTARPLTLYILQVNYFLKWSSVIAISQLLLKYRFSWKYLERFIPYVVDFSFYKVEGLHVKKKWWNLYFIQFLWFRFHSHLLNIYNNK